MEAVYWYNVTAKDDAPASTAPANMIYSYTARIKDIDVMSPMEEAGPNSYKVGDRRKEGKAQDTRNRSARINTLKPWETD